MSRLVRAEIFKLRSTGALGRCALAVIIVPVVAAVITVRQADLTTSVPVRGAGYEITGVGPQRDLQVEKRNVARRALAIWTVAAFVLGGLGVVAGAGEQQHGTLSSTLLAVPRRRRVVAGKAIACAAVAGVLSLPAALVGVIAALTSLSTRNVSVDVAVREWIQLFLAGALVCMLVAAVGVALGLLVRSVAAGLALGLAVPLVLEPVAADRLPSVARYLPDYLFSAMLGGWPMAGTPHPRLLASALAGLLAVAATLALVAVAARSLYTRELR